MWSLSAIQVHDPIAPAKRQEVREGQVETAPPTAKAGGEGGREGPYSGEQPPTNFQKPQLLQLRAQIQAYHLLANQEPLPPAVYRLALAPEQHGEPAAGGPAVFVPPSSAAGATDWTPRLHCLDPRLITDDGKKQKNYDSEVSVRMGAKVKELDGRTGQHLAPAAATKEWQEDRVVQEVKVEVSRRGEDLLINYSSGQVESVLGRSTSQNNAGKVQDRLLAMAHQEHDGPQEIKVEEEVKRKRESTEVKTVKYKLKSNKPGRIIGREGQLIIMLEKMSKAVISMGERDEQPRTVRITGSQEEVDKAKALVLEFCGVKLG